MKLCGWCRSGGWLNVDGEISHCLFFLPSNKLHHAPECTNKNLFWLKAPQLCWTVTQDIRSFNHVWGYCVRDLWGKNDFKKTPLFQVKAWGGSGGGRELFFDQKQIHLPAGNICRGGQSENVMLSHAVLTTTAMALSQALTTPPPPTPNPLVPLLFDQQSEPGYNAATRCGWRQENNVRQEKLYLKKKSFFKWVDSLFLPHCASIQQKLSHSNKVCG